jgi:hypothetical protein
MSFSRKSLFIFEERCLNYYPIVSFSKHLVSTSEIISKAAYLLFPNIWFQPQTSSPRQLISCFPTFGFNHRHHLQDCLSLVSQHLVSTTDIISMAAYLLFPNIWFQPQTSSPRQLISCFPTFGFNHTHHLQDCLSLFFPNIWLQPQT